MQRRCGRERGGVVVDQWIPPRSVGDKVQSGGAYLHIHAGNVQEAGWTVRH